MKKKILTVLLCLIFVAISCLFVACDEVEQQEETFPYVHSSLGLEGLTYIRAIVYQQDQYLDVYPHDDLGNATIVYKSTFNGEYPSLVSGSRSKVYETTQLPKYEVVIWQYKNTVSAPIYISNEVFRTEFGSQNNHYNFRRMSMSIGEAFSKTKERFAVDDVPYFRPSNNLVSDCYKEIDTVNALINDEITTALRTYLEQEEMVIVGGDFEGKALESNQKAIVMNELRTDINVVVIQVYEYQYWDHMAVEGIKRRLSYEFASKTLIENCASWKVGHNNDITDASTPVEIIITMNEDGTYTATNPHQEYQDGLFV
ncbi:MAG: hypothetical protein J6M26_00335 [Clostridia bacterium]|nr:hypothetical protein [Clostridia bacterium]MBP3290882.1 hypothetical protein [Clostridia bacterium]